MPIYVEYAHEKYAAAKIVPQARNFFARPHVERFREVTNKRHWEQKVHVTLHADRPASALSAAFFPSRYRLADLWGRLCGRHT